MRALPLFLNFGKEERTRWGAHQTKEENAMMLKLNICPNAGYSAAQTDVVPVGG